MLLNSEFSAVLAALFWSVTVILLRLSGFRLDPVQLTFFKSMVALVCFWATISALSLPLWPALTQDQHLRLVVSAVLGISIADTLFVAALNRLGASRQALADCIYAPAVALVGLLMFGESLNAYEMAGGALVLAGVATGVARNSGTETQDVYKGVALATTAHVVMAVGILMVRDIFRELSVVWVAGYRFLWATAILGVYGAWRRVDLGLPFRRLDLFKWTIPLSVLGPFLATICWIGGFKYATPGRAAIYNQLSTVFIIILAWICLGERLSRRGWLGVFLAATGSLLVATS